jgi:integrase
MASVERRNGRWRVRYRATDGTQRSETFDRKADADRFAKAIDTDQARGQFVDLNRGRVTLEVWAQEWRATVVHLRPSTVARDESYLRTHVLPTFGQRPIGSIEHVDVQAWVAELTTRKAPATVTKAFQILAKMLDAAVAARMIAVNPCHGVKLPRIEREEMRFLTPGEIARLADAVHPRYRALVLVAAYGGLRIGEVAGLKRHRVDLLRRRIEIAEIAVEVKGAVVWGAPKTRAGRRSITLPRPVMDELTWHLTRWAGDELVFTSPAGAVLRTPAWRRRFWMPAVVDAGLAPLRPHDLRHTAVALWIAAGANVLEVSRRAGHTSTSFTLDRYGHLFPEADDALSDRLGALYTAPEQAPLAPVLDLHLP